MNFGDLREPGLCTVQLRLWSTQGTQTPEFVGELNLQRLGHGQQRRHDPDLHLVEVKIKFRQAVLLHQRRHQHLVDDRQVNVAAAQAVIPRHGQTLHADRADTGPAQLEQGNVAGATAKVHHQQALRRPVQLTQA